MITVACLDTYESLCTKSIIAEGFGEEASKVCTFSIIARGQRDEPTKIRRPYLIISKRLVLLIHELLELMRDDRDVLQPFLLVSSIPLAQGSLEVTPELGGLRVYDVARSLEVVVSSSLLL